MNLFIEALSSSATKPRALLGIRLWIFVFDPQFSLSRFFHTQFVRNEFLRRAKLIEPRGRAGSSKRKRQSEETEAEKAESSIPDCATARDRVYDSATMMHTLIHYAGEKGVLASGSLENSFIRGHGSADATTLADPIDRSNLSDPLIHVASPELNLRISRETLAANLEDVDDIGHRYLNLRNYVTLNGTDGFRWPTPCSVWALVPATGDDALQNVPFPKPLQDDIKHMQTKRKVSGGLLHNAKPVFEKLKQAE